MRTAGYVTLMCLLAGCGAQPTSRPAFSQQCPPAPEAPAPIAAKKPTPKQVSALEIRVELWAEQLLAWGKDCARGVAERDAWIASHR